MKVMSKEVIENYLRSYSSRFPIKDLKQKLVDGGYSKNEVDEVWRNFSKKGENLPEVSKKGGFRWLRWTGIFIFVFLIFGIFNFLTSFISINFIPFIVIAIVGIIFGLISLVGVVIVVGGWFGLARYSNSKLMKFGLRGLLYTMIGGVISIILFVIGLLISPGLIMFGVLNFILIGLYALGVLFVLICFILIQVALIKLRKEIKFAGIVGILSLILFAMGILSFILQTIIIEGIFGKVLGGGGFPTNLLGSGGAFPSEVLVIVGIATIINFVNMIFMGLMFFDASKKFEV